MAESTRRRIHFLDELRGFAVLCMIVQHGFYCIGYVYDYIWARRAFCFFYPATPYFAAAFIIISGMVSQLSRSNVKRGLKLLALALGMTLVTALLLPDCIIMFGVIHMLSVCMILFGLLKKPLEKVNLWVGLAVCAVGFYLTVGLYLPEPYVGVPGVPALQYSGWQPWAEWLFPLGFRLPDFFSADYYSLLPWIFAFFGGGLLGRFAAQEKLPQWTYKPRIAAFSWVGRHALWFYILHQPLIMAGAEIVEFFIGKIG
ncbi:MAG: DUF1624 domain-containing protein [Clostridia bacterium]|nr:DUF1624 domain-containing protein [Clostridia bacterium]